MQQANLKSLRREFVNPFSRMLPVKGLQADVYRMAENIPPGLEGYQPRFEVVNAVILALQTLEVRVDLMTDFHLLAILSSVTSNVQGGCRGQCFDMVKQLRLMDRGVQFSQMGGNSSAPFFLREPYRFDQPRSQMLVLLQNMEDVTNTVQMVFYGAAAPFQGTLSNEY
jgi:hypothetical protein